MTTKSYVRTYEKDPFTVSLKAFSLHKGLYHVVGQVSDEHWQEACADMGLTAGGNCFIDVDIEKTKDFIIFKGHVNMKTNRTCGRTLEEFELEEHIEVDDRLCLSPEKLGEMDELFTETDLHVKDFIMQQIIVGMDPYPVHPGTKSAHEEGAFDVTDGIENDDIDEKNPFSVLKHLKS